MACGNCGVRVFAMAHQWLARSLEVTSTASYAVLSTHCYHTTFRASKVAASEFGVELGCGNWYGRGHAHLARLHVQESFDSAEAAAGRRL